MAGDDGGVMLIGRLNCYVSIDETIFDFNSAGDRGGVIASRDVEEPHEITSPIHVEMGTTDRTWSVTLFLQLIGVAYPKCVSE